jgi:hypothetical protein
MKDGGPKRRKRKDHEPVTASFIIENNIIDQEKGCWLWQRAKSKNGYAQIWHNGKLHLGHRLSWVIFNGMIPEGLFVLHECDVPSCVNPDHLVLGNSKANTEDMMQKGRHGHGCLSGVNHPNAKLTLGQVNQIRKFENRRRASYLADQFNVSVITIKRARQQKSYAKMDQCRPASL